MQLEQTRPDILCTFPWIPVWGVSYLTEGLSICRVDFPAFLRLSSAVPELAPDSSGFSSSVSETSAPKNEMHCCYWFQEPKKKKRSVCRTLGLDCLPIPTVLAAFWKQSGHCVIHGKNNRLWLTQASELLKVVHCREKYNCTTRASELSFITQARGVNLDKARGKKTAPSVRSKPIPRPKKRSRSEGRDIRWFIR